MRTMDGPSIEVQAHMPRAVKHRRLCTTTAAPSSSCSDSLHNNPTHNVHSRPHFPSPAQYDSLSHVSTHGTRAGQPPQWHSRCLLHTHTQHHLPLPRGCAAAQEGPARRWAAAAACTATHSAPATQLGSATACACARAPLSRSGRGA
mmetsp:Transcript_24444/g.62135  ORF Transcript_24444/g.62135 Transcript_24444/m.62135 type:complete len:147 (+) Transcript_24444:909-1349(+)